MKTKDVVAKYDSRAEYLRSILAKTYPASLIDKERLTYADIRRADSTLLEYWRISNATYEAALYPEADKQTATEISQCANFTANRRLTAKQLQTAKDAMDRLCRDYPAMVNNAYNQGELSAYVVERQLLPTWQTVRGAYLELATTGKLMLVPSRVGIHRLGGDALVGAYQVGQLNADELKKLTTPFRSLSEREQIDKMSADQYYRSEHGRALREERNRTADNVIRERQFLGGEAAVDFFLAANRDYVRSDKNRRAMLDWIGKHANGLMNKNRCKKLSMR